MYVYIYIYNVSLYVAALVASSSSWMWPRRFSRARKFTHTRARMTSLLMSMFQISVLAQEIRQHWFTCSELLRSSYGNVFEQSARYGSKCLHRDQEACAHTVRKRMTARKDHPQPCGTWGCVGYIGAPYLQGACGVSRSIV